MDTGATEADILKLCDIVRQTSYDIHCYFREGHLEKIYENALTHRLTKRGIATQQQFPLPVYDEDGTLVGDYFADLFIENCLIVELKACRASGMAYLSTSVHRACRKNTSCKLFVSSVPFCGH